MGGDRRLGQDQQEQRPEPPWPYHERVRDRPRRAALGHQRLGRWDDGAPAGRVLASGQAPLSEVDCRGGSSGDAESPGHLQGKSGCMCTCVIRDYVFRFGGLDIVEGHEKFAWLDKATQNEQSKYSIKGSSGRAMKRKRYCKGCPSSLS